MVQAEPLEAQLVDWIGCFDLDEDLRALALHAISNQPTVMPATTPIATAS